MYICVKLDIYVWCILKIFVGIVLYNLYLFYCLWKVCCYLDLLKDLFFEFVIWVLLVCLYYDGGFFVINCIFLKFIYYLYMFLLYLFWCFVIKYLKKVCCCVFIVWFYMIYCSCFFLLKIINFIYNVVLFEVKIKNVFKIFCI